jgi:outer membrane phospholipase A
MFLFQVSSLFAEETINNYSPTLLHRPYYFIAGDADEEFDSYNPVPRDRSNYPIAENAKEKIHHYSPMSLYKSNYFIAGNNDNQVKFQFSAKYQIHAPDKNNIPLDSTWDQIVTPLKILGSWTYIGYTQTSWWLVYHGSDTFSTNYQPEGFFMIESKNNILDLDFGPVKYLKIAPFSHCSTGVEGEDHRSINEYYGEVDISLFNNKKNNIGLDAKLFGYYSKDDNNKDINDYRDNYEAKIYYNHIFDSKIWNEQMFNLTSTGNPTGKGYFIVESISKLFGFQPKLLIQFSNGYGVNIVDYNIKETEFRIGLLFD